MYLLKWKYQPNLTGKSWFLTIAEQRRRIAKLLRKNPSLKAVIDEAFQDAYEDARYSAMLETGLNLETFPENRHSRWLKLWTWSFCLPNKVIYD